MAKNFESTYFWNDKTTTSSQSISYVVTGHKQETGKIFLPWS